MSPLYPMDVINSKNWYLTLPTKVKATPDTVKMPDLKMFSDPDCFFLNSDKDGVVFRARTDGAHTKNSSNPRSELREMTQDGKKEAAWDTSSGVHSMTIDQMVTALPKGKKPHVVVGQIHDASDDVTVFRFEGNTTGDRNVGSLWITDGNTTQGKLVTASLRLNTRFVVGFTVMNGIITYTFNGEPLDYSQSKKKSGCYFKAGSYNQSGGIITKLEDGKADFAEVVIFNVQVCHDKVCTGNPPGFVSGEGGDTGGGGTTGIDAKELGLIVTDLENNLTTVQGSLNRLKALLL